MPAALIVSPGSADRREVSLDRDTLVIGRDADCDVVVDHPLASRRHARISRDDRRYRLEDGDIIIVGGGTPFFENEVLPGGPSRVPEVTAVTQIYDVGTNSWSPGPSLPTGRVSLQAAQAGNTLIAFGGYDGTSTVATVDRIQGPPLPVELLGFRVE